MADVTKSFQEHGVIPDVLPASTKIPYNLGVHWPSVSLRVPAERLHRDMLQDQPKVTTDYKPNDESRDEEYVLLMVDPDLTRYNDSVLGQVRHWLVAKVKVDPAGDVLLDEGGSNVISPYVGPAPLAAHLVGAGDRPSRYIFLLLRHGRGGSSSALPAAYSLDPATLRGEYEGGDTGKLGGDAQHIVDRMRFDTRAFIEGNGLEVVAGTFMFVEGNVKSSLTNAALLASGVAQKAVGQ